MTRPALVAAVAALALAACDENLTHPTDRPSYDGGAATPLSCLPDLDGLIGAAELAPALGEEASYIVTPPLPQETTEGFFVNTAGAVDDRGRLVWDWSQDDPSNLVARLRAEPLVDQWYAGHFPGGQFALPADLSGELVGIYSHDDRAMRLHGVASAAESPPAGQTLMVYLTPIDFFPFDLTVGKSWTQTGVVENGTLRGLTPWSQEDTYEVAVDAAGELRLPDFTFSQVLRVTTKVTVRPKAGTEQGYSQRQVSFLFECFGEVGRATSLLFRSPDEDPGVNFTTALEIRRLGWF